MIYTSKYDIEIERYVATDGTHAAWVNIMTAGECISAMYFCNEYEFDTRITVSGVVTGFYRVLSRMGHAVRILDVSRETGGMIEHPYNEAHDCVDWVDLRQFA